MTKILLLSILFYASNLFTQPHGIINSQHITLTQDSALKTKRYYKDGLKNEEDYISNKIVQCRIFMGDKLMYISPITRKTLQPSIIRIKSGNEYLRQGNDDTLEIINQQIPMMNFAIQVKNARLSYAGEKTYLIKPSNNAKPGIDRVEVYVKVVQEMNKKIKRPVFVSDSAFFSIQ